MIAEHESIMQCRHAFFTTESVNDGKKQWLTGLMRSLQKYNLYCHATESQLQSYLMGKYEAFLEQERTEDDWPLRVAANVVGLQKFDPEDPFVQESGINPTIRVWVLNSEVQISETGQLIDPATSPFVWIELRPETNTEWLTEHSTAEVCIHCPSNCPTMKCFEKCHSSYATSLPKQFSILPSRISSPPA